MSSDKHSLPPSRYRCEAISADTLSIKAAHSPSSLLRKPTDPITDDPASLIGQALGHVRQGDGLTGPVPASIISRLEAHADRGNPACRVLIDWLVHRNRAMVAAAGLGPVPLNLNRRLVRGRRQAVPGNLKRRKHERQDAMPDPNTAIIAATRGGEIDG